MSMQPVLNDEQWLKLLGQVGEQFNEVTLSRGFNYFKQQFVVSLNVTDGRIVQAKVTGAEDYKVMVNLEKLSASYCTCPVERYCKHQAAALMELADRQGYPVSQLMNAKQHLKRMQMEAAASKKADWARLPEMDVNGWQTFLDKATALLRPSYDPGLYMNDLRKHMELFPKKAIPFSAIDWVYFELHQELFLLRKLKEQAAQGNTSYSSFALQRLYEEVHGELRKRKESIKDSFSEVRLKQTIGYMREQIAQEQGNKYMDYGLYMAVWNQWIAPLQEAGAWAETELGEIERLIAVKGTASPSLAAAQAYMYLYQGESDKAWAALEASGSLEKSPAGLFQPFLQQLDQSGQWESLVEWLIKSVPHFYALRSKELDAYIEYWKEAASHYPEAEESMWTVLNGMLPLTASVIEDLLYEQHKWKQWLELQIWRGHDPFQHRVSVLQPIEKEAPQLLLPYYHQAIEHYVGLKNRHDYKQAVKLLKRLDKVYKKLKQPERWDRFFQGFLDRYSRLRALQEEIKKGKLAE